MFVLAVGVHSSELGESRLNIKQLYALEAMYHVCAYGHASMHAMARMRSCVCVSQTHPAVQAARTVLHSQLLSGGLKLMRDGEALGEVKFGETNEDGSRKKGVTKDWAAHLEEHWIPFAKDVIDCYLKWGLCPVVFEVVQEDTTIEAIRKLKREVGVDGARKRKAPPASPVLVPHVPHLGTYEIAFQSAGKYGYTREYLLYTNAPGMAARVDEEAMVFVRQHCGELTNAHTFTRLGTWRIYVWL